MVWGGLPAIDALAAIFDGKKGQSHNIRSRSKALIIAGPFDDICSEEMDVRQKWAYSGVAAVDGIGVLSGVGTGISASSKEMFFS